MRPGWAAWAKPDGEEHEVRAQHELGAGDGLALLVHAGALHAGDAAVTPLDAQGGAGEFTLGTLGLGGGGAELGGPIGPHRQLVFLHGRYGADVELGDRERTLAEGGAHAIRGGVAAAHHHHVLAAGEDRDLVDRLVAFAAV